MDKAGCKCACKTQAQEAKANAWHTDTVCLNCYFYNPKYYNGYCELHQADVSADKICGDFKYP